MKSFKTIEKKPKAAFSFELKRLFAGALSELIVFRL